MEEFYNFYDGELTMGPLNRALREWEAFYNEERPRQSLGWRTPMEYLRSGAWRGPPNPLAVSYAPNEYTGGTRRRE